MHGTDRSGVTPGFRPLASYTLGLVLTIIVLVRLCSLPLVPLLDKSEARYAYIGELMVQTGNWITPFIEHGVPFWAKPVLSTWLTAASLAVFGMNAFAARFSSFLIFIVCLWVVFLLGRDARERDFGLAAACVFASTALAFYLGGSVMTDPSLMLGVTLTMAGYWKAVADRGKHPLIWGYVFFFGVAIGVLAKGPIGAIIPGMSIVTWATQQRKWRDTWRNLPWIAGTLLCIVLVVPWYAAAEHRTPGFLRYFIIGEHFERFLVSHWEGDLYGSGRAHPIGSIWLFGIIAALPWSATMLVMLCRARARAELFQRAVFSDPWISYLIHWVLAPLVLFTFARNILITYVATALPAFALMVAHALRGSGEKSDRTGFAVCTALVPVLMCGLVAFSLLDPGSNHLPSQAATVAAYKKLVAGKKADLVYIFNKPYSADFYSGGNAKLAANQDDVRKMLSSADIYFAIDENMYHELPTDLRQELEVVGQHNKTFLLHKR